MADGFIVEGIPELQSRLQALGAAASRVENSALKAAAQPILDDAQATTAFHDRSGDLRSGLKISGIKRKGGVKYVQVGILKSDNSHIFYGKFIEWGTSKMAAKPFMDPAYQRNKAQVPDIIKAKLREALGL